MEFSDFQIKQILLARAKAAEQMNLTAVHVDTIPAVIKLLQYFPEWHR